MVRIIVVSLIIAVLGIVGFMVYDNMFVKNQPSIPPAMTATSPSSQPSAEPAASPYPIFAYLSPWVPEAIWDTPYQSTKDTPYGKLTGQESSGKITGESSFKGRSFEDPKIMNTFAFTEEDIKFSADGPGASQWGYTKIVDGLAESVIFSYSTQRLLGPENASQPFANISVFVSDPYKIEK